MVMGLVVTSCLTYEVILLSSVLVNNYVLSKFSKDDEPLIRQGIDKAAKAAELIIEDKHDFIVIYNGNYDSRMHKTGPESIESLGELRHNVHAFAMDEWADEDGNVAPLTYGAGLGYSFMNHFYARIREDLRPPVDHWHTLNNDNKGTDVYSNTIDEITGGGVDVVYTATGWPGHTAFIDPRTEEFKADTLEEFCQLGSRIVTTSPLTICENSMFGPMGNSGDVWATPYKAATIGPRDIMHAKERFELHNLMLNEAGCSWQRMVSRLELYGPITMDFPASILRLGKGTCYVSEAIAAPFRSWYNGMPDSEID